MGRPHHTGGKNDESDHRLPVRTEKAVYPPDPALTGPASKLALRGGYLHYKGAKVSIQLTPAMLKEGRKRLGMTQAALAEAWGIHRVTLVEYETGRTEIPQWVRFALLGMHVATRVDAPGIEPSNT